MRGLSSAWVKMDGMRLRIFTEPQQGADYATLRRVAQAAERLGFDAFFRSDHYLRIGEGSGLPGPTDAWATLSALAVETSGIRLGTLVSSATFRLPGPLAIAVAPVDQMRSRLRKPMPILAPRSTDRAVAAVKDVPVISLTLDAGLEKVLEPLARDRADALRTEHFGRHLRRGQCELRRARARRLGRLFRRPAGRAGGHDPRHALAGIDAETVHLRPRLRGWFRSSGKPDRGPADPVRLLRAGKFRHDLSGHGAGAQGAADSLNVPAIALLDRVGASRLSSRLKQAGANLVLPKDEAPGLAMGLGGVGVTLQDLVQLYSGLARLGTTRPLREIVTATTTPAIRCG